MKKTLEVEVQTATQCSFIPFTPVPDGWAGGKVRIELAGNEEQTKEGPATEPDGCPTEVAVLQRFWRHEIAKQASAFAGLLYGDRS